MPAVAIVAAVGTVSAGAAMGGVLGGIMMAGGVMTGLGAVTGNKNLQRIGMVASLGAGIGSALGLAGAANSAWNSAVGAAADGAGSALGVTGNSFLATGGSMEAIGNAVGYNSGATAGLGATQGGTPTPDSTALGGPSAPGAMRTNVPSGTEASTLPAAGDQGLISGSQTAGGGLNGAGSDFGRGTYAAGDVSTESLVRNAQGKGGFIDSAMGFLRNKDNAEIIKAGTSLIGGAMKSYSEQSAAEDEYNRRRQATEEARARYNASITNQPRTLFRG